MKGLIVRLHGPSSRGPSSRGPPSSGLVVTKLSGKKEYLKVWSSYDGRGSFYLGDWIEFTDLVETDRGIKRQVCIIRDPDFPWVRMDIPNWESTVELEGRLFINRIVHQEGSTRYYEDWTLGPVAINVHDCPDWTDREALKPFYITIQLLEMLYFRLLVAVTMAERGRRIPGSQFYCWWTVVVVTPLQPGPVFLEAQMQRENERRVSEDRNVHKFIIRLAYKNLHQNMAAADQGEIMENENEQNRHQQNNEAVERIDGDREENRIENLNEEFLENGEQEDGNIVEDLVDLESSAENEEEDNLPNIATPPSIAVNKHLKQQQPGIRNGNQQHPGEQLWLGFNWKTFLIFALLFLLLSLVANIIVRLYTFYF